MNVSTAVLPIGSIPEMYRCPRLTRSEEFLLNELNKRKDDCRKQKQLHDANIARLLPVELFARERLEREWFDLNARIESEIGGLSREIVEAALDDRYTQIDMRFMSQVQWSEANQCDVPVYALFDVNDSLCTLEGFGTRAGAEHTLVSWRSARPQNLLALCGSVATMLESRARRVLEYRTVIFTMAAKLGTPIADDCRQRIAIAVSRFDRVLLLTEAPDWRIAQTTRPHHFEFQASDWQARAALSQAEVVEAATVHSRTHLVIGQKRDKFWFVGLWN